MLRRLRSSSRLATLLVLALAAGPTAMALCPHPGEGEMHHEMGTMETEAMTHHGDMAAMDHEMPPCHEEAPQPEPEETDCLSPCCVVAPEAPAPAPPVLPVAAASAALAVVIAEAEPRPEAAPLLDPEPPPSPPLRVHLLLGRFLT